MNNYKFEKVFIVAIFIVKTHQLGIVATFKI